MASNEMKIDLARIPEGEMKDAFVHFAEKHDALVDAHIEVKQDIDQISGDTPEAKAEIHQAMGMLRKALAFIHGKRFNTALFTMQAYILLGILKQVGITPHQFSDLMDAAIGVLRKIYQ